MGHIIGIDLGTTYSCVAYIEGTEPRIIPNLEGLPTTPSVVSFTDSGDILIGNLALRQAITNPDKTIFAVKRLMGKKFDSDEVQDLMGRMPYKLAQAPNGDVLIEAKSDKISPQELSAIILKYLRKSAESYFGEEVTNTIITVPAHFNDHQRQATKDAAKIAGLNVMRVINEPTAASLAYGLERQEDSIIAVYDMGGGTFDITLMEISNGIFHVLATNGSTYLGGIDFDARIMDWMLKKFEMECGIDLREDKYALQRVHEAAEKAKRELSFSMESEIHLPFITADDKSSKHLRASLTRGKLESLTKDLIDQTFPLIDQALGDCRLGVDKIDDIILVGGQTRMPLIRKTISEFFRKPPVEHLNPDEIVAMGAAVQSAVFNDRLKDLVLLLDVTPLSLGIETEHGRFVRIIEKNTTIPTRKTMAFTTVENNQRRVRVHVLQGENETVTENISLAHFDLVGIGAAPAGVPQIDVTFEINADGIVTVSAKDIDSGREQGIEVKPASGLSKQEVDNIILKSHKKATEEINDDKSGLL